MTLETSESNDRFSASARVVSKIENFMGKVDTWQILEQIPDRVPETLSFEGIAGEKWNN